MKFVSKARNYSFTVKPGIPREPLAGRPGIPGIYVRFEDHIANVVDPMIIELLRDSTSYNVDFVSADSVEPGFTHKDVETQYMHKELKHGSIDGTKNVYHKVDAQQEIERRAIEIAKQIAPKIAIDMLKAMQADADKAPKPASQEKVSVTSESVVSEETKLAEEPVKESRRGRPKKI